MIKIPTTKEIYDDLVTNLQGELLFNIPVVGKYFNRALCQVLAGSFKLIYLTAASVQKNIFPDTADSESVGGTLERFGMVKLNRRPEAASAGVYQIQVTGSIGAIIPASTTFKSDDNSRSPGKLYILDNAYTLPTATAYINVRSLEPGIPSKLNISDGLSVTAPIANLDKNTIVISETTSPLDAEDIEIYRGKVLDAFRLEPQGGAPVDYRLWSKDVAAVKQSYPYAVSGFPNEINVFVEVSLIDSTDGKGTPSGSVLTAVGDVLELDPDTSKPIEERGRRPLGVHKITVLPVIPKTITITITGLVGSTSGTVTLIAGAIDLLINGDTSTQGIRPFVSGADLLEKKNDILSVDLIKFAIFVAKPGAVFTSVTMFVDGVSFPTYLFLNGDIPYFNSNTGITYAV